MEGWVLFFSRRRPTSTGADSGLMKVFSLKAGPSIRVCGLKHMSASCTHGQNGVDMPSVCSATDLFSMMGM